MAFLVPLLLPSVLDATTNLAVGISNTIQSTSSSFSIQLGSRVFTNNKGFPLPQLPYELREKIVLMALEESRSLILPPPLLLDPRQPMTELQFATLQARSPLHPSSKHYRSIVGERREANGFPVSAWRWLGVSREWWVFLRKELWRDCVVGGWRQWANMMLLIESPDFHALPFIHSLILHEGFSHPSDIYAFFLSPHLTSLTSLSLLPLYPFPSSPYNSPPPSFSLGLQLIPIRPTKPPLDALHIGLPLDVCTTEAGRQHLGRLRPRELGISLRRPTEEIWAELEGLIGGERAGAAESDLLDTGDGDEDERGGVGPAEETRRPTDHLSIRYLPTRSPHQGQLIDPQLFIHLALSAFPRVTIYLPRWTTYAHHVYPGQEHAGGAGDPNPTRRTSFAQKVVDLIASDTTFSATGRMTVWVVEDGGGGGGGGGGSGGEAGGEGERVWPVTQEEAEDVAVVEKMGGLVLGEKGRGKEVDKDKEKEQEKGWERQTDLRLFGGFIGVRMESRKT